MQNVCNKMLINKYMFILNNNQESKKKNPVMEDDMNQSKM